MARKPTTPNTPAPAPAHDWVDTVVAQLPPLATTTETAAALRLSRRQLKRYEALGKIKAIHHGTGGSARAFFPRDQVAAYLRSRAEVEL